MDYFYIIVLSVAVAILIILLTIVGIGLKKHGGFSNSNTGGAWPPIESTCPDYWTIDPSDPKYCLVPPIDRSTGSPPRNSGSIYKENSIDSGFSTATRGYDASNKKIDFTDPYYTACNKQSWAKKWGIYWDGYTNYNGCS
jgi:hypothetical protein